MNPKPVSSHFEEDEEKQEVTGSLAAAAKAISTIVNCQLILIWFVLLPTLKAFGNKIKH